MRRSCLRFTANWTRDSPITGLMDELAAGGVTVPDALSAPAKEGVADPGVALRSSFAPAARTALADARDADKTTGLVAFLQRQTGARSVTPQEGDSPDAVLSRAEAALAGGDVAAALSELQIPARCGQGGDWRIGNRRLRRGVAAVDAANALQSSVNSN